MENIKVLFLTTDLGKGGAERYLVDLCNELNNHDNIEYIVGSLFDNNQYKEHTKDIPVVNLNYQTFTLFGKNSNPELKRLLDEFKPDIIHSHRFLGEFITSYYVDPKIKYVTHGHDNMIQLQKFKLSMLFNKTKFLNFLEGSMLVRKKYKKTDTYFISNSSHTDEYYKRVLPSRTAKNVTLIQYGFNFKGFFNPEIRDISKKERIELINVGSFQPKKNQLFLLNVAKELKKKGFNFHLKLVGVGECREMVLEKIEEMQLTDCVEAPGVSHIVDQLYKESDIYIHSAYYEPFGLVFLEAMASGLPIVTLDGKGNRDIIERDKNGFLFFEQDAEKYADKIIEYASDQKKYGEISNYAKEFSKQFDATLKMKEMIDFYQSILD
ncbi:MAG: glycosyltransferase family 4 protein [Crocinitomicaceae bacterium]|nr:glycosyltransferase family 4 protein [Crocinitomicaceae bacterium]